MNKTATITITEGHQFTDGRPYTLVDLHANNYGGGSPCTTEEEIQHAIQHFKEWVTREGDKYKIQDERQKNKLTNWL